jgi:hypothetical protein
MRHIKESVSILSGIIDALIMSFSIAEIIIFFKNTKDTMNFRLAWL